MTVILAFFNENDVVSNAWPGTAASKSPVRIQNAACNADI